MRISRSIVAGLLAAVLGTSTLVLVSEALRGDATRAPAEAQATESERRGVSVSGLGRVYGTPDVLRLSVGVTVRGANVNAALNGANAAVSKVTKALRDRGVAEKDIQTAGLSVQPEYAYREGEAPRITGYSVSNSVIAKLRNLARAGDAISAAATASGNDARVDGVSFDLEDNAALLRAARDAAYREARAKAEQYATLAGRSLGDVVFIEENVSSAPPPVAYGRDAAMAAEDKAGPVPVSPGQQEVSVTVLVRWAFK